MSTLPAAALDALEQAFAEREPELCQLEQHGGSLEG